MIEFEVRHVRIPFRFRYGHARKSHVGLDAVVCAARDADGHTGWGEAVPRTYVTGETCDTVMTAIPKLLESATLDEGELSADVIRQERIDLAEKWRGGFPSCGCCAIDIALQDLLARRAGLSCASWHGAGSLDPLVYSASIGVSKKAKLLATLMLYRTLGFRNLKVKVRDEQDIERIRWIRRVLGKNVNLFADANANWDRENAIRHIETLHEHGIWAIEEPLRSAEPVQNKLGDFDRHSVLTDQHMKDYSWLRDRSPLPLIADESLICLATAKRIVEHQGFDILNVRLSKCGGPWMSTAIVELARTHRLRFAIGAMVGETPILATAGAHFAALHRDHLYVQGFSHRLLHGRRFATGDPAIRRGGKLQFSDRPGLGLRVDPASLDACTICRETFPS